MIKLLKNTPLLPAAEFLLLTLFAIQAHAAPQPPTTTPGGLLYFNSRSLFEASFPGLPKEDFEESPVAAASSEVFPEPLDNTTDVTGVFQPSDILEGVSIQTVEGGNPATALLVAGDGWKLNTSNVVGPNHAIDTLDILFPGNDVYAVGMDVLLANSAGTAIITIYGPGGTVCDTLTEQSIRRDETFFGFYSSEQPITRISINAGGAYELVDNIQFGGSPSSPLTLFANQATFENVYTGLILEDFEDSAVADNGFGQIGEPLNSSSGNAYFNVGDIVDGLAIRTLSTSNSSNSLMTVGGAFPNTGNSSKAILTTNAQDNLVVVFPNFTTYTVGMDLLFDSSELATIAVYDIFTNFLGVTWLHLTSTSETFFGVHSNTPIGYIRVHNNIRREFVDNIQFGGSPTGLTIYPAEADFKKARSSLPKEDFSKVGPVADNSFTVCNEPIDSTTNQVGCFEPDDILPGVSFKTEESINGACPACIALWGKNTSTLGNTTPLLEVTSPDQLEIAFSGKNVHYVGLNLHAIGMVSVYGANDTFLGTAFNNSGASTLNFWGVRSSVPISRITIGGSVAMVNEILFGPKFPWPAFMPNIIGNRGSSVP